MLAHGSSRVGVNRSRYYALHTENSLSTLIRKNALQSTDLLRHYLRMLTDERLMSSGCPMKGSPSLLCHPRAAGSGQGVSALHGRSSVVTKRKRAGSHVPQLLLPQWEGPEYPTQDAELLAVLRNVHTVASRRYDETKADSTENRQLGKRMQ